MPRHGNGPSVEFVRKYVLSNVCTHNVSERFIKMILEKHIPDSQDEIYGTWEGFDIFGINYVIFLNMRREIRKYKKAIKVFRRRFVPIWLEKAYKIDGCMYKSLVKNTLVGKT